MIDVRWLWVFLDEPAPDFEESMAFWAAMTSTTPSPRRGEDGQFLTLLPDAGDAWIKMQATGVGQGIHLDFDVDDVHEAADVATGLGARRIGAIGDTVVLMRSPGGFGYCFTTTGTPRTQARETGRDLVDQVCLDLPADVADAERTFWADLTGWPMVQVAARPEFHVMTRPDGIPVRLMLQTRQTGGRNVTGHVDLACSDRAATVQRHLAAGATVVGNGPRWTVLTDPVGRTYCATDRDPGTGLLP